MRERLWYLSMLFVLPGFQGAGLGRELLERLLPTDPDIVRAVAADSAQPISNALYAKLGMVPRMPLLNLSGLPQRPEAFGELPSGVVPLSFDEIVGRSAGRPGPSACWPTRSTSSIASCWASPTRSTTASCAPNRATAGCTAARTGRRSGTAMPARPGGSGRWPSATRRCSGPCSVT